jgi:hypothetical protein
MRNITKVLYHSMYPDRKEQWPSLKVKSKEEVPKSIGRIRA